MKRRNVLSSRQKIDRNESIYIKVITPSQFSSKKFEIEINAWEDRPGFALLAAPFLTKFLVKKRHFFFWKKNVLRFSQETLGKYKYSMEITFSNIDNRKQKKKELY